MHSDVTDGRTEKYNILMLSPHCDDICFSLGASVHKMQKCNITIWNIFTKKIYSRLKEDVETVTNISNNEEMEFVTKIGANVIFEGVPEALLRGYQRLRDILLVDYIDKCREEYFLLAEIKDKFAHMIEYINPDIIFIPMGCGGHVDHVLIREVGIDWFYNSKLPIEVYLYEELPYMRNDDWRKRCYEEYVKRKISITPIEIDISDYLQEKENLMRIYNSQIKEKDIKSNVSTSFDMHKNVPVERIWRLN